MSKINFQRSIDLISLEKFNLIQEKTILIAGLGGVGGTAFEALVRSGFKKFILIDKDVVDPTNLNRQILYTENDIGLDKVICAKNKALSINFEVEITTIKEDIGQVDLSKLGVIDFIIDAIDDVKGKVYLAKFASENNIEIIISLGMANRFDPSKVQTKKLNKTTDDPLARKVRYEFKNNGIDISKINVVASSEIIKDNKTKLSSIMMVPSSAGLSLASYVLNYFIKEK